MEAVSSILGASAQSNAASTTANNALNANFDLFLSLLTTQLQNQDPLDPLDTSEMTSQLVQFSSVEQTIATNANLEQLIAATNAQTSNGAVEYIGKEVEALATAAKHTEGEESNWRYSVAENAPEINLTIVDSNGATVYTETVSQDAGTHSFTWDGQTSTGDTAATGIYFLMVTANDAAGEPVQTDVRISGVVDAVDFTTDPPVLMIGDVPVNLSDVTSVKTPSS